MTEFIDKKYWVDGWWMADLESAKEKAEKINRSRISYTADKPKNLKLIAIRKLGRWWTNKLIINIYKNQK